MGESRRIQNRGKSRVEPLARNKYRRNKPMKKRREEEQEVEKMAVEQKEVH
jgi:hypothetical protein